MSVMQFFPFRPACDYIYCVSNQVPSVTKIEKNHEFKTKNW